jgi:hypothetical protein
VIKVSNYLKSSSTKKATANNAIYKAKTKQTNPNFAPLRAKPI